MRNAPSMRLERKKVTVALIRSNCGGSGVLRVVFPPLKLTTSAIQGTSVRMIPRKVCCIVHGASPDFCSANEFSICFICHYIIRLYVLIVIMQVCSLLGSSLPTAVRKCFVLVWAWHQAAARPTPTHEWS